MNINEISLLASDLARLCKEYSEENQQLKEDLICAYARIGRVKRINESTKELLKEACEKLDFIYERHVVARHSRSEQVKTFLNQDKIKEILEVADE